MTTDQWQQRHEQYMQDEEAKAELAEAIQSIEDEDAELDRKQYLEARNWTRKIMRYNEYDF